MDVSGLLTAERVHEAAQVVLAHGPRILPEVLTGDDARRDLIAGRVCDELVRAQRSRSVLTVVDGWLGSYRTPPRRRHGSSDARTQAASAYLADRIRAGLVALFSAAAPDWTERESFLLVFLWRQFYLNPLSALQVLGDTAECPAEARDIVQSLFHPFGAPIRDDAGRLWGEPRSETEKLIVALWLMALPTYELTQPLCRRALANTTELCRGAIGAELGASSFDALVTEAMTALFGACYGGENTVAGLSALGDLVAAEVPRRIGVPPEPPAAPARLRPRIGYLSMSFRGHSVARYMANRIVHHDRERYEVVTFSVGRRRDATTELIAAHSDEFVELPEPGDVRGIAAAVRARALDLLVVVDIGMEPAMHLIGGVRMATRQIGLMGHAASTGLPSLTHYLSGDHEGPDAEAHYRERLVRLPNLGAAQLRPGPTPAASPWRSRLGIPDDGVIYVNLANGIKLMPERDWIYWEILSRVPRGYLVIKPFFAPGSVDPRLLRRLQEGAAARGVSPRLRIVPPLAQKEQVGELLGIADVQLDTFPFGGWTTNLDALWAGVPLVTREGRLGISRFGATFLRKLDLTDGIATDDAGYVDEAVRLGLGAELRARVRARIRERAPGLFFDGAAAQPAYEAALDAILRGS